MWTPFRTAPNLAAAEAWQDFLEEAGIPCELYWPDVSQRGDATAPCQLLVPNDRMHVVELVLSTL